MSDHYQEMMNYHYACANKARRDEYRAIEELKEQTRQRFWERIETIDPELTPKDIEFRLAKLEKELEYVLGPDKFTNYIDLTFPKRPSLKIYPETLKRCTIGINDAS
ncbi:hypothetical protein PBI_PEREGRIN_234 [Rhodococcus phage Peregrin]|nr:hypothetical protein PBI_PEREGRIN_234 [Rhodococcus phage Peregrin]